MSPVRQQYVSEFSYAHPVSSCAKARRGTARTGRHVTVGAKADVVLLKVIGGLGGGGHVRGFDYGPHLVLGEALGVVQLNFILGVGSSPGAFKISGRQCRAQ